MNQRQFACGGSIQHGGGFQYVQGIGGPHTTCQPTGAKRQPKAPTRHAKARIRRCKACAAGHYEVGTRAEAAAMRQSQSCTRRMGKTLQELLDAHEAPREFRDRQVFKSSEVETGAEIPAIAAYHQQAGFMPQSLIQRAVQVFNQRGTKRVRLVGPTQQQCDHTSAG